VPNAYWLYDMCGGVSEFCEGNLTRGGLTGAGRLVASDAGFRLVVAEE
jgi:formylglycine-generating enzyme required for sulfatase activity